VDWLITFTGNNLPIPDSFMPDKINKILKQYWGFDSFRPLQEDIIESVLSGKDTLALMPTGGGKSLCYQVPAMAKDGLCLVISPLIALMKDQVENLRRKNITAYSIFSGMTRKQVIQTLETVTSSNCKFLYVSPERLETALFKEYLPGLHVTLIAVDEAHCISQWGYDFRPPYLRIAALRDELPGVPVLALTASATPEVQTDICDKLNKVEQGKPPTWQIFRQSFERPNLSYSVFTVDSRINKIIEILNKVKGTGIVYCKSRKRTKEISELLRLQNIPADFYHAGLSQEERNGKQEAWIGNKTRVIVCTNAFGMGIDKPDVRVVIHADTPDCLENYYQEAGRAGRDGRKAYAVLLYDEKELQELNDLPNSRFPTLADIRTVYQSVANYLQIETGTERKDSYDFDLGDFLKKFKLNSLTTIFSLKALEQDGWLTFNEQVFLPPTIRFTITKERLYDFENDHPKLEGLVKGLLRAYEGIFDHTCFVSEMMMAQLLKKDIAEITQQLLELDRKGIIEYVPRKETPQLSMTRHRVKAEELTINMVTYRVRKEKLQQRINTMIRFVREETECRGRIIASYFGDKETRACGICDNCLRRKSTTLSKEEFETIHLKIVDLVGNERLQIKELLGKLTGIKKEKAWQVIEFLQAENKIEIDKGTWLKLT
jgi:ATP-dependent DNA helicase RecQ